MLTTCELQLPGDFNRVGEDALILKGHAASAASDIRWTFLLKRISCKRIGVFLLEGNFRD